MTKTRTLSIITGLLVVLALGEFLYRSNHRLYNAIDGLLFLFVLVAAAFWIFIEWRDKV